MDFDLWLRLLDAGVPAAYIPEALAVFEIHSSSKTGSIDLSEFYREEALSLLKSGRRRSAAASLGRAAAAAALTEGGRIDSRRLATTIGRFEKMATTWGLEAERRVVRPAAFVEAARFEFVRGSPRGLRHLARPDGVDVGNLAEDDRPRRPPGGACSRSASTQAIARTVTVNSQ